MLTKFLKSKFDANSFCSIFNSSVDIVGDIVFEGVLKIEGSITGCLIASADDSLQEHGIILEPGGSINSPYVVANYLVIGGKFNATRAEAHNFLHIKSTAEIENCEFICDRFQIDDGAKVNNCKFINRIPVNKENKDAT